MIDRGLTSATDVRGKKNVSFVVFTVSSSSSSIFYCDVIIIIIISNFLYTLFLSLWTDRCYSIRRISQVVVNMFDAFL